MCAGEVLLRFQTSLARGLSTSAHARACAQNDPNELPATLPTPSPGLTVSAAIVRAIRPAALAVGLFAGARLCKVRGDPVALRTLGAAGALLGVGCVLGRFQETLRCLREHVVSSRLVACQQMVLTTRSAKEVLVPSSSLVPGDIVHLQAGFVPADCRVLASSGLCIDDSFLAPRGSRRRAVTEVAADEQTSVLEAGCMAFATASVISGTGRAVVTRTGNTTAVCSLLSRLSSFSPVDVLLLPWSL